MMSYQMQLIISCVLFACCVVISQGYKCPPQFGYMCIAGNAGKRIYPVRSSASLLPSLFKRNPLHTPSFKPASAAPAPSLSSDQKMLLTWLQGVREGGLFNVRNRVKLAKLLKPARTNEDLVRLLAKGSKTSGTEMYANTRYGDGQPYHPAARFGHTRKYADDNTMNY